MYVYMYMNRNIYVVYFFDIAEVLSDIDKLLLH